MGIVNGLLLAGILGLDFGISADEAITKVTRGRLRAEEVRAEVRERVAEIRQTVKRKELEDSLNDATEKSREQARKVADEKRELLEMARSRSGRR